MNARDIQIVDSFRRVPDFLDRRASALGTVPTHPARRELDAIVNRLTELELQQLLIPLRRKTAAEAREKLTDALRLAMSGMVAAASLPKEKVASIHAFRVPNKRATTRQVILAVRALVGLTAQHRQALADLDYTDAFMADLLEGAETLEDLAATSARSRGALKSARAEITSLIADGRLRAETIDAFLHQHLTDGLRAEWEQVKRVGRVHRPAPKTTELQVAPPQLPEPVQVPAPQARPAVPLLPILDRLQAWVVRLVREPDPAEVIEPDATSAEVRRISPRSSAP